MSAWVGKKMGGGLLLAAVALAGCASNGNKQVEIAPPEEIISVAVHQPVTEKDALGNYRFLMQDGETKMSADQFDAWMKANGIRVAKGTPSTVGPEAAQSVTN
jgi:hypothetical protein